MKTVNAVMLTRANYLCVSGRAYFLRHWRADIGPEFRALECGGGTYEKTYYLYGGNLDAFNERGWRNARRG